MIRVARADKPEILKRREAQWRADLEAASTEGDRKKLVARYRHRQIRAALELMFHGKCAYCESYIPHVTFAHIEHYRPKATFPDLTFSWGNLLLACGKCNSPLFKGERFPQEDEGGPLLDPCTDLPEEHLRFEYDARTKLASVYGKTGRGLVSEMRLGLNRAELRTHRSMRVRTLAALLRFVSQDAEARQLFDEAKQNHAEYAAFARALDPG